MSINPTNNNPTNSTYQFSEGALLQVLEDVPNEVWNMCLEHLNHTQLCRLKRISKVTALLINQIIKKNPPIKYVPSLLEVYG